MVKNVPVGYSSRSCGACLAGLTAALLSFGAADVPAACTSCSEWSYLTAAGGLPTTPIFAHGVIIHAIGDVIYLRRPVEGSPAPKYVTPGVWRTPSLTAIPDELEGSWYIFATLTDGHLVKLDVPSEMPAHPQTDTLQVATTGISLQHRDMRRGACPTDTLLAEPVVQRRADSNAQFTLEQDIVMVATAHACGDTTQNQVMALDAADVTRPPVWVFNSGEYEIAKIRTCLLDLGRNLLHCAAEHPASSVQYSLFSIDTNTGSLAWGAITDTGVHARPALGAPGGPGEGHLYVGDQLGRVHSFDADDGTSHGSILIVPVADGVAPKVDIDLTVGAGDYAGRVFPVGSNGEISALVDIGTELIPAWESSFAGGQKVVTQAVPVEEHGRLYAGTNDGFMNQLQLGSGSAEASANIALVGLIPATTDTMSLGVYLGEDGFPRLVGTVESSVAGNITKQWKLPCEYASSICAPLWQGFKDGFE